eukprot:CAMPEP_0196180458 /NCGR_PEP_ID=MMETSP0911-20130528/24165_1 /TAXON_ID=49265 /ORGANISM="Thalassiosira rotula, Strain GSO102" /LENGTH=46 /DNA_ID= /DNA_START= /DNA_END= /DNA_ORIENTATION=
MLSEIKSENPDRLSSASLASSSLDGFSLFPVKLLWRSLVVTYPLSF